MVGWYCNEKTASRGIKLLHRGDRDIDLLIVPGVVAPADLVHLPDDGETGSVDGDRLAQYRMAGEEQLSDLLPEHGDAAILAQVRIAQEAPLEHGDVANHRAVGFDAGDVARGVAPLAYLVQVRAAKFHRNSPKLRQRAQCLRISRSQLYATALAEFLSRRQADAVTERLNAVYSRRPAKLDAALQRAQLRSLDKDSW